MELTDDNINRALARAGVPKRYRNKEIKLKDALPFGPPLLDAIKASGTRLGIVHSITGGGVLELVGTEAKVTDAFYLGVRSFVLKQCPITIINAMDLHRKADVEFLAGLREHRVLAIEGLTPNAGNDPLINDRNFIEWTLIRWLNENRGLFLLSDGEIISDERWSERFRRIVNTRMIPLHVSR